MNYFDKDHENFVKGFCPVYQKDNERMAAFYICGLSPRIRENFDDIYDFESDCFQFRLEEGWMTGSDWSLYRLALNLYNGYSGQWEDEEQHDPYLWSPRGILAPMIDLSEYLLNGIQILTKGYHDHIRLGDDRSQSWN